MTIDAYRDEIKLELTGGVLDLELDDPTLDRIICVALREIQRYIDTTKIVTLTYSSCMDLTDYDVNSVTAVYRTSGVGIYSNTSSSGTYTLSEINHMSDPMYADLYNAYGMTYGISYWTYNYISYVTLLRTRNTMSTDLIYYFDKPSNCLYINCSSNTPSKITVEYVPVFTDVSQITSDMWIDNLMRLAKALTKVTLGRVRSKYKQSNALWTLDGDTLLAEGNAELTDIRTKLDASSNLVLPID